MPEYRIEVRRSEIHYVSESVLNRERTFQKGKEDRKAGVPCLSSNGAYLNGWYSPEASYYYIGPEASHLL